MERAEGKKQVVDVVTRTSADDAAAPLVLLKRGRGRPRGSKKR
jgi:hypothetical protein